MSKKHIVLLKTKFDKLTFKEKAHIVFSESGRFIAIREYYNQRLVLYDMGEFFAEVWYEPLSNQIFKIDTLELSDKRIDLYIVFEIKTAKKY